MSSCIGITSSPQRLTTCRFEVEDLARKPGGILSVVRQTSENRLWEADDGNSFRLALGNPLLHEIKRAVAPPSDVLARYTRARHM
jgi:hypothetical protein